ncbi:MAG: nitroreductase family protein [Acetobacteraceae bacterium]
MLDRLLAHRSVRAYRTDPLPPGTTEILVAAAQSAASSSNLQLWSVVAVEDPARKARLAAVAAGQKHITQAPLFLVWLADLSRAQRLADVPLDGLDYLETFMVGVVDAALAAQNATVAAESLGLGTVYIGALRNNPEAVAAELGLPPRAFAVFGMCVGASGSGLPGLGEAAPAAIRGAAPGAVRRARRDGRRGDVRHPHAGLPARAGDDGGGLDQDGCQPLVERGWTDGTRPDADGAGGAGAGAAVGRCPRLRKARTLDPQGDGRPPPHLIRLDQGFQRATALW